jgi:hypothetical protein
MNELSTAHDRERLRVFAASLGPISDMALETMTRLCEARVRRSSRNEVDRAKLAACLATKRRRAVSAALATGRTAACTNESTCACPFGCHADHDND